MNSINATWNQQFGADSSQGIHEPFKQNLDALSTQQLLPSQQNYFT